MTIAELIKELQEFPADMEVMGYDNRDGSDTPITVFEVPEYKKVYISLD